jgi:hypothetical protein
MATLPQAYLSVCHVTLCYKQTLYLPKSFIYFVVHFIYDGWQNRGNCMHQVLHKAQLSTTEIPEMLQEAFGAHSSS